MVIAITHNSFIWSSHGKSSARYGYQNASHSLPNSVDICVMFFNSLTHDDIIDESKDSNNLMKVLFAGQVEYKCVHICAYPVKNQIHFEDVLPTYKTCIYICLNCMPFVEVLLPTLRYRIALIKGKKSRSEYFNVYIVFPSRLAVGYLRFQLPNWDSEAFSDNWFVIIPTLIASCKRECHAMEWSPQLCAACDAYFSEHVSHACQPFALFRVATPIKCRYGSMIKEAKPAAIASTSGERVEFKIGVHIMWYKRQYKLWLWRHRVKWDVYVLWR